MAKKLHVFKCDSCGSVVEVLHESGCEPACCGVGMRLLAENSTDAAQEKHLPVVERVAEGWLVKVGSVAHPMETDHYIEWIELLEIGTDGEARAQHRAFLRPGDRPEALFRTKAEKVRALELCNKHGLWKN